jgi:hypothetical protein|eukprot:CAMPEP_0174307236 /NCGR_PEP_ID=MMETSP0810-20121108/986_1 /TAXON_ID=73025 ORGANISM="Eutreptiella gymnastica-like, Strain CCMP1594" /NCGR_SAMPLE_ID=MMETSP0810 /ASSEMBLY_ACC=CAM_ASM_000659 /LENGTH=84 /DNA_ID=CAMNT_0015414223 /DNA_START=1117 /DNA_END=1371 /DNA_ORIENTATION=+
MARNLQLVPTSVSSLLRLRTCCKGVQQCGWWTAPFFLHSIVQKLPPDPSLSSLPLELLISPPGKPSRKACAVDMQVTQGLASYA